MAKLNVTNYENEILQKDNFGLSNMYKVNPEEESKLKSSVGKWAVLFENNIKTVIMPFFACGGNKELENAVVDYIAKKVGVTEQNIIDLKEIQNDYTDIVPLFYKKNKKGQYEIGEGGIKIDEEITKKLGKKNIIFVRGYENCVSFVVDRENEPYFDTNKNVETTTGELYGHYKFQRLGWDYTQDVIESTDLKELFKDKGILIITFIGKRQGEDMYNLSVYNALFRKRVDDGTYVLDNNIKIEEIKESFENLMAKQRNIKCQI